MEQIGQTYSQSVEQAISHQLTFDRQQLSMA